jgi:hypothetical protein
MREFRLRRYLRTLSLAQPLEPPMTRLIATLAGLSFIVAPGHAHSRHLDVEEARWRSGPLCNNIEQP